jgi:probable HAF family extracellular repeat protein
VLRKGSVFGVNKGIRILLFLSVFLLMCPSVFAVTYSVAFLGDLGGGWSSAAAINDSGQIVGSSANASGVGHAYVWSTDNSMYDLGAVISSTLSSSASDINNVGAVVGKTHDSVTFADRPFLYNPEAGVSSFLGDVCGTASAVNDSGQIAGTYISQAHGSPTIAYRRGANGTMVDLYSTQNLSAYAINSAGAVVGYNNYNIIVWPANGGYSTFPGFGGIYSWCYDISDFGLIVGSAYNSSNQRHGFVRLLNGTMIDLGYGEATGVNESGAVVGWTYVNSRQCAYVWNQAAGFTYLDAAGYSSCTASDINENGWVSGTAYDAAGASHAVLWQPVPDPPSGAVLSIGICGLTALLRRPARRRI